MYFDRVVSNGFRLEAYFHDELVALRLRGSSGWVTVPLQRELKPEEMVWTQPSLPVPRATAVKSKLEPHYESFEEAP